MVNCIRPDRVNITRPVFKSRLCDGVPDCFHGEDEDGSLLTCEQKKETVTWYSKNCPKTIILSSDKVQKCTAISLPFGNSVDYWRCVRIDDSTETTSSTESEIRFIDEKTIETDDEKAKDKGADYFLNSTDFAELKKNS